jgi:hypothetical protein
MKNKTLEFHAIVEKEAVSMEYGQMTVHVYLKNGIPVVETIQITKQKRIKFKPKSQISEEKHIK